MKQLSFMALGQKKKLRCEQFLDEMSKIIPWDILIEIIGPYHEQKDRGRKRKDLLVKIKMYFLQQWYNLSDPGVEEAVYDRISFQKFLDIDLLQDTVPDETTLLRFRHMLEENNIQERIFDAMKHVLEEKNLIMKKGTIFDATILSAPSSTKNEEKSRDPEMSSTKKGNTWYFGMKAHIGVDSTNGIVHSLEATAAKVHDKKMAVDLFHGEESACFGDKGYYDEQMKSAARKEGIFWGILDRGKRGMKLSVSQKNRNHKLQTVRSKVEFPFHVLKCLWGYRKVRYKGIYKNKCQLYVLFGLVNMYRMRKVLLPTV